MYNPAFLPLHPSDCSRQKLKPASDLASVEKRRRDSVRSLGLCFSGCEDLDKYVLSGGFERGSVVGISAEDEDEVGLTLSLQVLVCSLLEKAVQRVQIATPKPPSTIIISLKNIITAELKVRGFTALDKIAIRERDCLDRIMLSRVFDMDGLCEVLADLDIEVASEVGEHVLKKPNPDDAQLGEEKAIGASFEVGAEVENVKNDAEWPIIIAEIQDSQDEDETLSPSRLSATSPLPGALEKRPNVMAASEETANSDSGISKAAAAATTTAYKYDSTAAAPDIILITHVSSLLTSLFTQRDKSVAYATLRLLASRLRRLSRTLISKPLILLTNSTDSGAASPMAAAALSSELLGYDVPPEQPARHVPSVDSTLRSIFNPTALSSVHTKPNKPTFGLVFTQLLDVHLLCTRASRIGKTSLPRGLIVIEVLLDDSGIWDGERGLRRRREQRWTVVAPRNGRVIDVCDCLKQAETSVRRVDSS